VAASRWRGGLKKVRALSARRNPNVAIRAVIGTEDDPAIWRYSLEIRQDNQKRPLVALEQVRYRDETVLARPGDHDRADPERLTQTHLEQVAANTEFRDVAQFFGEVRYLHLIPQLVRNPRIASDQSKLALFGGDFLERLARASDKAKNSKLKRIERALRIAVPKLKELTVEKDPLGIPHLKGRYEHWRQHGAWQTEEQFSDGTLRLMGLLWAVMDGEGPLLLEEPELSLHAAVVRHIPQMLARAVRKAQRQVILSTHSWEMLGDTGIAPDEVLLLEPSDEGTRATIANSDSTITKLLQSGLSLSEVAVQRTAPQKADQLSLFEIA